MSVSQVRLLAGDIAQIARFEAVGDGVTLDYLIPEHPILTGTLSVTVEGTALTETTEYTINTKVGLLHLNTPPTYGQPITATYQWAQFDDQDLQDLLSIEGDNPRLAAADALDAIASNTALLQGRISMLDLTMDGTAVASALQAHAAQLRAQSETAPPPEDEAGFDIAEMTFATNWPEKVAAEGMRGSY